MLAAFSGVAHAAASPYRITTFTLEVTPPLGHALMGGGISPAKEIVDPLSAQGIVLLGFDQPLVWLSVDWCEIRNDAYDTWREALAQAAGTTRDRVLIAAIHQHDTPVADFTAQKLLDEVGLENALCDVPFVKDCIARSAEALAAALADTRPVNQIGVGEATVSEVASNRRIVGDDGVARYIRNSSAPDEALRAAPIGLIDSHLRTLSFWQDNQPVAAFSTYAVHPMSYYGRGGVSSDFIGMARKKMREQLPGTAYLYFSGCSGDVVAGKHNDGSEAARESLANSLFEGMQTAWNNTKRFPLTQARFRTVPMTLPMRDTPDFTEEEQERTLKNTSATIFQRNLAAMGLSWRAAQAKGHTIDVSAIDFGPTVFLLLPAESFVQYQLDAQALRPDTSVLVAGYGESAPGYIPSAQGVRENFIADHTWCWVSGEAPQVMAKTLTEVLEK